MTWPGDYTKSQEITIPANQIDADVVEFPVLLTEANFQKVGADIFDTCRSDGGDIRMSTGELTGQMPRENVSINVAIPKMEFHTKRTLDSTLGTSIWVSYNGTDTEPAEDSAYGKENTWKTEYKVVHHMTDATTSTILDSTSNDNDITKTSADNPLEVTGLIGEAQDFGTGELLSFGTNTYVDEDVPFTIQTIINFDTFSSAANRLWNLDVANNAAPFIAFLNNSGSYNDVSFGLRGASAGSTGRFDLGSPITGEWKKITLTYTGNGDLLDRTDYTVRINGAAATVNSSASFSVGSSADNYWGGNPGSISLDGKIDDSRILVGEELSSTWESTEYNNQSSPSTFYSVSDEQGGAPPEDGMIIKLVDDGLMYGLTVGRLVS